MHTQDLIEWAKNLNFDFSFTKSVVPYFQTVFFSMQTKKLCFILNFAQKRNKSI